jgi:hypothetical protein
VAPVIGLQCSKWRVPANLHQTKWICSANLTTSEIMLEGQQMAILELEGVAVATALEAFRGPIKGARLVVFTDDKRCKPPLLNAGPTMTTWI